MAVCRKESNNVNQFSWLGYHKAPADNGSFIGDDDITPLLYFRGNKNVHVSGDCLRADSVSRSMVWSVTNCSVTSNYVTTCQLRLSKFCL